MKTKNIVIVLLSAMVYGLFIKSLSLTDMYNDSLIKFGWYNEYGESHITGVNSVFTWLFLPYSICYYVFSILLLIKLKKHINKWAGGTMIILYGICLIPSIYDTISCLYVSVCFHGDDMCLPMSYWEESGKYDWPLVYAYMSMWTYSVITRICYWIALITYVSAFAMLIKKDKIIGIVGLVTMLIVFIIELLYQFYFFSVPYIGFGIYICWIILCATILWRLYESPKGKPFVLQ